jgi:hypothetical protein
MFLIYLAHVLEWIFFIGLAGSLVVSVAAFVGDLHVFFEKDVDGAGVPDVRNYAPGPAGADD